MPYQNWDEVNPAIKGIDPRPSLAQANMIARWADRIEQKGGAESPWAAAIALFKRSHHVEGGKWVKNEGSEAEHADVELLLEMLGLEIEEEPPATEGLEFAYVIDLMADVPQKAGRPDFSQPFCILPAGPIYRHGSKREVTAEDIDQFADNWVHRQTRGIRRKKVVIDLEHEPGGVGEYGNIYSRGSEGLYAKIKLSKRGDKALAERDFWFFSPTVAWKMQDSVTGETVKNQIAGGALTNYPVFGDQTALPLAYSEAALFRLWQDGHQVEGYATKTEDGREYPASAYLVVEDPDHPTTWHLRYKEYVNGELLPTKNVCGRAAAALNPNEPYRGRPYKGSRKEEAKRKLRGIYLNTLKVPKEEVPKHLFSTKGDDDMTAEFNEQERGALRQVLAALSGILPKLRGGDDAMGDDKTTIEVTAQAFAELQKNLATLTDQVQSLSQERDQLKQKVEQGEKQLSAEVYARQLVQMRQHAEQYKCLALPVELPEGAPEGSMTAQEHFSWLFNTDATEAKTHWAFFNAVLAAANKALEEAQIFSELGGGAGVELPEDEALHQKALTYAKEHEVDYYTALKAVSSQQ